MTGGGVFGFRHTGQLAWVIPQIAPHVGAVEAQKIALAEGQLVVGDQTELHPAAHVGNHRVNHRVVEHHARHVADTFDSVAHLRPSGRSAGFAAAFQRADDVRRFRKKLPAVWVVDMRRQPVLHIGQRVFQQRAEVQPHRHVAQFRLAVVLAQRSHHRRELAKILLSHHASPV